MVGSFIYLTGAHFSNTVITVADRLADEVRQIAGSAPFYSVEKLNRKLVTIHNGIDVDEYKRAADTSDLRSRFGVEEKSSIIGAVSRLDEPKKGVSVLLKAARLLKDRKLDFKLLIAGDGGSRNELMDLTKSIGLGGDVIFLGYWDKIPYIMGKLDMFVLSSLSEGFPIVNLEAMATGLPVISTDVGGVSEVVLDGVNGLLVKPGDEKALADALETLIKAPDKAREMGKKGRAIVEKNFVKGDLLGKICSFYEGGNCRC